MDYRMILKLFWFLFRTLNFMYLKWFSFAGTCWNFMASCQNGSANLRKKLFIYVKGV